MEASHEAEAGDGEQGEGDTDAVGAREPGRTAGDRSHIVSGVIAWPNLAIHTVLHKQTVITAIIIGEQFGLEVSISLFKMIITMP